MFGKKKNPNLKDTEKNMQKPKEIMPERSYQNTESEIDYPLKRKIREQEEKMKEQGEELAFLNQQVVVYQELQKLQTEEVFRYNLLQQFQILNKSIKGIGQNLIEVGKILDEMNSNESSNKDEKEYGIKYTENKMKSKQKYEDEESEESEKSEDELEDEIEEEE